MEENGETAESPRPAPGTSRILVVDDEEFIRDLVRDTLEHRGYVTRMAQNGEEALECLAAEDFDIMITDVVMPGLPGLDLVKRVKSEFPRVHMIVLTGYARDQDIGDFLLEGADDLLPKPFRSNDLVEVIRKVEQRLKRDRGS